MRIQSFQNMESEYNSGNGGLYSSDLEERKKSLEKYTYSVIVEGEHSEFENLEKWIIQNISEDLFENIYYGKTGYNFGFAEYFINEKEHVEKLNFIVPCIYTVYPKAYPSRKICKSESYEISVDYDSSDLNAIIFDE